jgi:hypothetical protein
MLGFGIDFVAKDGNPRYVDMVFVHMTMWLVVRANI